MLSHISISQLRSYLVAGTNILCGAGVSMTEPTRLPSGNQLRDLCVRGLLSDEKNKEILDKLLETEGYQRLLPEAVLQDIGLFASKHVDKLIAKIIAESQPNAIHGEITSRFPLVFTTNFDMCFERAGAQKVVHLHGAIDDPSSLQNRVFRLGKGRDQDLELFETALNARPLLIVGYSLRDEDVLESLSRARPDPILFLSYDGETPPFLTNRPLASFIAKGSAHELFCISVPSPPSRRRLLDSSIRKPALGARVSALLFLIYLSGHYELAWDVLHIYLPRLTGRTKYKAICSAADSLRIAGRFADATELCQRVLKSRLCRRSDQVDQLATANNLLALCALDDGSNDYARIEFHFDEALRSLEEFSTHHRSPSNAVGIEIFRARIINNLGLLHAARSDFGLAITFFLRSREIKLAHYDDRGVAQTDSNLAKCYMKTGDYISASNSLREVSRRMKKSPDRYICGDAITEILPLLAETSGLAKPTSAEHSENADDVWALLDNCIPTEDSGRRGILHELNELARLHRELY